MLKNLVQIKGNSLKPPILLKILIKVADLRPSSYQNTFQIDTGHIKMPTCLPLSPLLEILDPPKEHTSWVSLIIFLTSSSPELFRKCSTC